ncbi:WSC domain-domain-containing protein [Protomyces lactucae-debilis]|uniref:WSC domain-domain-containing protein n=1 Tax=Protomyces lactucae-debilis TaxID=2754530 RepID=A0A1Y2F6N1_PROLT|nr:WSC domain-containing protein [Protomyces lactucae-debilis]ORY79543.1 WSC domain-domain-containing protein [Protomyces lactucae-debilis]
MTKTPYRHYIAYSGPAPLSSPPAQCLLTAPVCTALVSDSISASTTSSEAPPATTLTTAIPTTTSEGSPISSLLGCFQDSAQFGGVRTFNGPSYVDTNGLTNQACASFCTSKGFPISATEYSQECYCGGDVPTTGSAVCSKPCSGDPTQVCGGDWALSVSRTSNVPVNSVSSAPSPNVTAIDYIPFKYDGQLAGCFADAAETGGVRTLSGATYRDSSSLTNEKCANFCGEKGFAYSGTEDGQECWCSSTLPTVSSTRCDAACKGNTTQTCGGPWALTVTINQAIVEQSSSATPSQPPYTALGCFADSVNARVFGGFSYTNSSMTPAQCAAKCSSLFFPFSGTEFGNECFCSQSAPISTSTQCNKPCAGNLGLICGGPDALTVFQDTSVSPAVPPTCPGLPSAFVACTEGQRVSGGKCVSD